MLSTLVDIFANSAKRVLCTFSKVYIRRIKYIKIYNIVPLEFLSIPPDGDHPDIRQIGLCLGFANA